MSTSTVVADALRTQLSAVVRRAAIDEVAAAPGATADDVARATRHMDRKATPVAAATRSSSYAIPAVVALRPDRLPLLDTPPARHATRQDYNAIVTRMAGDAQHTYNAAGVISRRLAAALMPVDTTPFTSGTGSATLGAGESWTPPARPAGVLPVERVPSPELLAEHVYRRVSYGWGTYDIHIMQGVAASGEQPVALSFGDKPAAAAGVQKLVGQVTMLLLTSIGSDLVDKQYGTALLSQAYSRNVMTARLNVARVLDDVRLRWQRVAAADLPDEERLTAITLLAFDAGQGSAVLRVKITTAAGASREIALPVTEPEVRYGY